jgi:hypothetical protein
VQVVLTKRDEAILTAVSRFRLCRSSDLARLYFSATSKERAAQRLRGLFDGGLLDVRVEALAEENLYSLGQRGRAFARERGLAVGRVPSGRVKHHLSIVRAWTLLAASVSPEQGIRLRRVRPDWEAREAGAGIVVPDLLVELAIAGRRLTAAIEVDRATERARAWQDKLARYSAVHADRDVALIVVAAGSTAATIEAVAKRAWRGRVLVVLEASWPEAFIQAASDLLAGSSYSLKGEEPASA